MAAHRYIDRICAVVTALTLLIALLFTQGEALGLQSAARALGYETRLFDTSRVHTIDLVTDDWEGFLETCENEEYTSCAAVIDGEAYRNIGLRAKGNTSLTTVSRLNSSRYSFKLEFDCYDSGKSYYGLDKLCLNNLIQDNTCMKDYTRLYHQYFEEFLQTIDPAVIIEGARALIAPYVERDPTGFCTGEEFEAGVSALKEFCALRTRSVSGQLSGEIPSTGAGQSAGGSALVDASGLALSDMGSMGMGGGFGGDKNGDAVPAFGMGEFPGGAAPADGENNRPGGMTPPEGDGNRPQTMTPSEDFDPSVQSGRGPMGGGGAPASGSLPGMSSGAADAGGPILLGASVLVLLAGLIIAFRFRR